MANKKDKSSVLDSGTLSKTRIVPRHRIDCSKGGLTEQSHAGHCDINYVIKRYKETGQMPNNFRAGTYGVQPPSFHERQLLNAELNNYYEEMPDTAKQRFDGVEDFKDMLINPDREEEAVKFGALRTEEPLGPYDDQNPPNEPIQHPDAVDSDKGNENEPLTDGT